MSARKSVSPKVIRHRFGAGRQGQQHQMPQTPAEVRAFFYQEVAEIAELEERRCALYAAVKDCDNEIRDWIAHKSTYAADAVRCGTRFDPDTVAELNKSDGEVRDYSFFRTAFLKELAEIEPRIALLRLAYKAEAEPQCSALYRNGVQFRIAGTKAEYPEPEAEFPTM
jgi:hypothetical protein